MHKQLSSIVNSPTPSRHNLNLLQKFLQNKNKYRQKYISHLFKQSNDHQNNVPRTSEAIANGNRNIQRHLSTDNLRQESLAFVKRANNKSQLKDYSYFNSDFNQFLLSQREKLRTNQQSRKGRAKENYPSTTYTKTLQKELLMKKQSRMSIMNIESIPVKEEPHVRHSSKENKDIKRGQNHERWKHFKKKKYVDSKFFSIKRFIINTASKEPPHPKKIRKNISQVHASRLRQGQQTARINVKRYQQTEILQIDPIDPWDFEPNQL